MDLGLSLTLWWLAIPGCAPDLVCGGDIPLTGRSIDADDEALIRQTVADFETWTGVPVCLREIRSERVVGRHGEDLAGRYVPQHGLVRLEVDNPDQATVLRHELCHLIDVDEGHTATHPDWFEPPPGAIDPEQYPTAERARAEYFAELCERGPVMPPLVAAVEGSCGDPVGRVAALVWRHPPWTGGPVRVASPTVVREPVTEYDQLFTGVSDRMIVSEWPFVWQVLDDDIVPELSFAASPALRGAWPGTIPGDGEIWWSRDDDGPPMRIALDGTATETTLGARAWRGGWHDDRLWLWDEDDPAGDVIAATGDGEVVGRSAPPDPEALRRQFVVWEGEPAAIVVGAHETRIARLPDGETLALLPTPMVPRRQIDGVVIGDYAFVYGEVLFAPSFDPPPNVQIGGLRSGSVWITPDGEVSASSPCEDEPADGDGVTARLPALVYDGSRTTLFRETVTWPLPDR